MQTALLPRGWHVISYMAGGRMEHYTPQMLDRSTIHRLVSGTPADVQDVIDGLAAGFGTKVDAFYDGRLIAQSAREHVATR